ncbi:MAG: hypothetical protein QME60_06050 [Verrucomicrobiota bacterium]|nr:hypothetical protein [Verrucomicrobiota bacterium]
MSVSQDFQMTLPMRRTFCADDSIPLRRDAYLENHYPLYLDDQNR